jgi:hypothetical protein
MEQEQLTLGKLLSLIKKFYETENELKQQVIFDFCSTFPHSFHSWRGDYYQISLDYHLWDDDEQPLLAEQFIKMMENDVIGKVFFGWKGGEFTMTEDTPVWVSTQRGGHHTAVVGVTSSYSSIIIQTSYKEY